MPFFTHMTTYVWKTEPPRHPILLVNSPFPFKILLEHLLWATFLTPPLDIHSTLLVCGAVAMFAELIGAKFGGGGVVH